jgi:ABC-type spermidine/putrescine transport system permease subunit I
MRRTTSLLLLSPSLLLILGLVLGPLLLLLRMCFYRPAPGRGFFVPGSWTLDNLADLTDPALLRLILFTCAFALTVAVCSVAVAYLIALLIWPLPARARTVALLLVFAPKTAGVVTTMFGLQRLLGETGPLNAVLLGSGVVASPLALSRNGFGAAVAESYLIVPVAVLILYLQLATIDGTWIAAARGLGATRWRTFRRVVLPLSAPGLALAFELSLMWGLGAFLGPVFLGSPQETTLAVEVYRQSFEYSRWPRASVLGAVSVLLLFGTWGVFALAGAVRRGRTP